jgi:hypothetical protein
MHFHEAMKQLDNEKFQAAAMERECEANFIEENYEII